MLELINVDLSNYGRSIKGIVVVSDDDRNVLILMSRQDATRMFGDAELLRNVVKDSTVETHAGKILESINDYPTLEALEQAFVKATGPVSVRFINETL